MTLSLWRYCHLLLALVSGAFLLVASITGTILSFEPITKAAKAYDVADLEQITLARTLALLKERYPEVLELQIDSNDFVMAAVISEDGAPSTFYMDPRSADNIGEPQEKEPLFKFATNLHRSLFLKTSGRLLVGVASFLLFLIAVTGSFLILKRQGSIKRFVANVKRESFEQYYHIVWGRLMLVPILVVSLSGVYLSMEKFDLLPRPVSNEEVYPDASSNQRLDPTDFPIFKTTPLSEVRSVVFPFSEDPEDYFQLRLRDSELLVNQLNGTVVSKTKYPLLSLVSTLSLKLHTGQGSVLWSIILFFASIAVLYFIYSGFKMALKRKKKSKVINTGVHKDTAEFVILVGSETGSTFEFAKLFKEGLSKERHRVYMTTLNDFTPFKNIQHLIIFTATYGAGEAPSNARKFLELLETTALNGERKIPYSVVGFGSLLYPEYCKFAVDIDDALQKTTKFHRHMALHKIHDQSFEAVRNWAQEWGARTGIQLTLRPPRKVPQKHSPKSFELIDRTDCNIDDTFMIRLRPKNRAHFRSGDLLSMQPSKETPLRFYSIAKIDSDILLSIKKHPQGICSNLLNGLAPREIVTAGIKKNPQFHFPQEAPAVVLICNGTGMAPFLGMLGENKHCIPVSLFWGGRTKTSFEIYENHVATALKEGTLQRVFFAHSQEGDVTTYVQDLVLQQADFIAEQLATKAVFMICGSVAMQQELLTVLENISKTYLGVPLSEFEQKEQLKMDCY